MASLFGRGFNPLQLHYITPEVQSPQAFLFPITHRPTLPHAPTNNGATANEQWCKYP